MRLPVELDNEGVIFAYGSLLEHAKLRELLKHRGPFNIWETNDVTEAVGSIKANPVDVVILRQVRLEGVRVSIVTETMLRRWYADSGRDVEELIDAGVAGWQQFYRSVDYRSIVSVLPGVFLCARAARPGEKGRHLHGGLVCNLSADDIAVLDKYEWEPVLSRTAATELKIGGRICIPEHITYYAGGRDRDISLEEKIERSGLLDLNRKRGQKSPQARWPADVRRTA